MSSGGTVVSTPGPQQPTRPSPQPAGFNLGQPSTQGGQKSQLLMQHLTSTAPRSAAQPTMTRSVSYIDAPQFSNNFSASAASTSNAGPQPQVLARRSSFSGIPPSPSTTTSGTHMTSPSSGAAAAAAAAVAAAASATSGQPQATQGRTLPQRHSSGGTVHHAPLIRPQQQQSLGQPQIRRLSDSLEMSAPNGGPGGSKGEDKQRSLLQQLLSE